ncbi:MAG TPA: hypothetical protein PKI93_08320 [Alphaproteobacteria bacterium]|nr:hypothetical protein [Alphaproteobacteria bacterium]HNS45217.1 hypothetical protein [Alphaproteobacteria bacterium]
MDQSDSLYTDFSVGFAGDHAAANCKLRTPRVGTSSRPKDRYHRTDFSVTTYADTFNLVSIGEQIDRAAELGLSEGTVRFLERARIALEKFVEENGNTNPAEAVDWEDVPVHRFK